MGTAATSPSRPLIRREVLLAALDLAAFCACTAAALHVRFGAQAPHTHLLPFLTLWPALVIWRSVTAYGTHLYDFRHRLSLADHVFAGLGAAFVGVFGGYVLLALVQLYYMPDWRLSRWVAVIDFGFLFAWYAGSRAAMLAWLRRTGYTVRVLLAGSKTACSALADEVREFAPRFVQLAGECHWDEAAGNSLADAFARLQDTVTRERVDQLVLAELDLSQASLRDLLLRCDRSGAEVYLYPALNLSLLTSSRVQSVAGLPVISLYPVSHALLYRLSKRALDTLIAALGLTLAAPLCIAAALAIKLTSPGPILFSQERVGRRESRFRIYKFRTMVADAEAHTGPVLSDRNDPRVTPAGRTLRRLRIDEIPQLWNVLRGDMSLVGPRPERAAFIEQFVRENPLYERRCLVRPGLTGLAQIHGRYDTDYRHKLRYDLIYINSMSLVTDLRILLATFRIVLTGKGAV